MTAAPVVHAYGPDPDQFLEVTLPDFEGAAPVVVVLHGGFWRARYGIELARPLAADLAARGWAAVAVEYRRVGAGGGWPATLDDVAAALDALPEAPGAGRLDLSDVTVVGHSAGGHLAAWVAARGRLPDGAPGARPRVPVGAVVAQAGVLDLAAAVAADLGDGATVDLLGGTPAEVPDRYAVADPARLLPTGVPVLCVHGAQDTTVPLDQSERFRTAGTAAGDAVEVSVVPGDHMAVIDLAGEAWRRTVTWLTARRTTAPDSTTLGP
ncbi:alpha/beta hydrolase family protein [Modestobacter italicus]|uniref:alpha/beta hydrolase family protein n=1 Tax=Modestobacter italicus (strain DSM 44449 / CECT 9708 / BC 501) TaxID=2732864 RepID=UPI001C987E9D|nr:alpha/beta hydrolase [Modestobacter italicus]